MKVFGEKLSEVCSARPSKGSALVPAFVDEAATFLMQNALDASGIFRLAASKRLAATLRADIDAAAPGVAVGFTARRVDVHTAGFLLKEFFASLPTCVLLLPDDGTSAAANERFERWLEAADEELTPREQRPPLLRELVAALPPANRAVLGRLALLLRAVADNCDRNLMTAANLGTVWGPNLLFKPAAAASVAMAAAAADASAVMLLMMQVRQVNGVATALIEHFGEIFDDADPLRDVGECPYAALRVARVVSEDSLVALAVQQSASLCAFDSRGEVVAVDSQSFDRKGRFNAGQRVLQALTVGQTVWTTSEKGLCVWKDLSGTPAKSIPGFHYSLALVDDSSVWAGGCGAITIFDPDTVEPVMQIKQDSDDVVLALCWTGDSVWTGGTDHTIRVYNTAGELQLRFEVPHKRILCITACGHAIWTGHEDGTICIWDPRSCARDTEIRIVDMRSVFHIVSLGSTVWCGSWDGAIRVFDARSHAMLGQLRPYHTDAISAIVPVWNKSRSAWQLWSASLDGEICVWKLNSELIGLAPPAATRERPKTLLRRPSIMVTPAVLDCNRAGLLLQSHRPKHAHLSMKDIEALADKGPLPGLWEATKNRLRANRESSVGELVSAALKHTHSTADPSAVTKWLEDKGIKTCGDLSDAAAEIWTELKQIAGRRVCSSMRNVLQLGRSKKGDSAAPAEGGRFSRSDRSRSSHRRSHSSGPAQEDDGNSSQSSDGQSQHHHHHHHHHHHPGKTPSAAAASTLPLPRPRTGSDSRPAQLVRTVKLGQFERSSAGSFRVPRSPPKDEK